MKSFGEEERELIKRKLLESCEKCWSKYGYKKTTIRELCDMSGISTGAFYLFFQSKEVLFFQTVQSVGDRIGTLIYKKVPPNPTKVDFAKTLKIMFREFEKIEWYLRVEDEMALIIRKLPPGFMEETTKKDIPDLSDLIKRFGLVPKINFNEVITILQLLSFLVMQKKMIGEAFQKPFSFIIDTLVENMFD